MALRQDNMQTVSKWGDPLPKGSYHFRITKVEEGTSTTSNEPMVTVTLTCQEEPHVGRTILDFVSLQKHALAKLKAYYEAVDYNPGPEGHDPAELLNKELYCYLDQDVYQGNTRNKVPPFGPRNLRLGKHSTQAAGAR